MGPIRCCPNHEYKTRGAWSPEEDQILIKHIELHGSPHNWRTLPNMIGLDRCGKSCRLRWNNYLAPGINKEKFTAEEEETIIKLQASLGNKWSKIAKSLPGRTDNDIKNHWGTRLRRRLISQGIDLNTEPRPSNDVSTSSSASTVTTTATATATNDTSNNGEKNGEVNVELSLAPPNYYYEDEDKSE